MPLSFVCPSRARPNKVSAMWEKRAPAGGDLDPHAGVAIARIPPVMPDARGNYGALTLAQDRLLPVALHAKLALEHREPLDESGMIMLPDHTGANERDELRR
jgi:hypothetical protein